MSAARMNGFRTAIRSLARILGLLAVMAAGNAAWSAGGERLPACSPDRVEIRPGEGRTGKGVGFQVEVAATPAARAKGLMGRQHLPKGHGMLFVFPGPGKVAFWMKDTPLPLDMIFISEDGTIRRIKENATPFDLTPIPAGPDILLVLELAGGSAARAGIRVGDQVRSPYLAKEKARWPCLTGRQ